MKTRFSNRLKVAFLEVASLKVAILEVLSLEVASLELVIYKAATLKVATLKVVILKVAILEVEWVSCITLRISSNLHHHRPSPSARYAAEPVTATRPHLPGGVSRGEVAKRQGGRVVEDMRPLG